MTKLLDPDARLFGLRIWRKKLSDAEFVDKMRQRQRLAKRYRYLMAVVGIGMVVMSCFVIKLFVEFLLGQGAPPWQQNLALLTFAVSIVMGATIGFGLSGVLHNSVMMLVEQRKDHLLVACWDALQALLTEQIAQREQETTSVESDNL